MLDDGGASRTKQKSNMPKIYAYAVEVQQNDPGSTD